MNRRESLKYLGAGLAGLGALPAGSVFADNGAGILTRPIPGTNETLPVIGLGTWLTFDVGATPAERAPLEEVMSTFAAMGGRMLDSSAKYGRSEEVAGDLMAKFNLRSRMFVATKVWTTGKTAGILQMEESMQKLRAPVIDLMQVHNLLDADTHLKTLAEWKKRGRVRYVGVTHYTADGANDLAKFVSTRKVDFVQINYSVGERDAEKRLLPLARDRGIAVIVNRPFAAGSLLRILSTKPLPGWAADIGCKSWAQALLKFVVSHPSTTCVIPGSSKASHVRDNMEAGMGRMPDKALRARIAADVAAAW